MLVAIRGGEEAIRNSHRLLSEKRRGNKAVPEIAIEQIEQQLSLAVDRVMSEGALYDRQLASIALKQSQGDSIEATFLVRAFRTTLSRIGYSESLNMSDMLIERRISPILKEAPGGHILGPTYDYTHRLIDFSLAGDTEANSADLEQNASDPKTFARITELLERDGIVELTVDNGFDVSDLTQQPLSFPTSRDLRLQMLARGDEGFLVGLANSTLQGYGQNFPLLAEIRVGEVSVELMLPDLGFTISIAKISVTECEIVNKKITSQKGSLRFTRGYGLAFGHSERKAIAMAVTDRALRGKEFGEAPQLPIENEEFVLTNSDGIDAAGLLQSLKLPHYVSFQTEIKRLRELQTARRTDGKEIQE
jgi:alpha-D-ribose 1-methylphosphonate 5-triphosphate synthase subunit PhnI